MDTGLRRYDTVGGISRGRKTEAKAPKRRPFGESYPPAFELPYPHLIPSPLRGRYERLAGGDRVG